MEQKLVEAGPLQNAHCNNYIESRPKHLQTTTTTATADSTSFTTMFSSVQVKQEYSGIDDNIQNSTAMQTGPEYPVFSDVEYMYRQLPYFWNQTQIQNMQMSEELTSENEAPVRQEPTQVGQFSAANYLHQNMTFPMGQLNQQNQTQQQLQLGNSSTTERGSQVPVQPQSIVHNSPGRPAKSTNSSAKSLKCRCEVCFKEFGHKSNLFIHMRTHNGERPYKCTQCDKCFTHSGNLAIHMRTHSGERPYACQICGKMFSHSGNLSTHLRTHSGVKPYKCSVCSKEFRHSGNLSIHERIHSGVKPFKCKVCAKEFYHSGNLTTHMKKHPVIVGSTECLDARTASPYGSAPEPANEPAFSVKVERNEHPVQDTVLLSSTAS